jgi:hypothetical protein
VAFVENGAFPNAGVKSTCEGDPALCGFSKAVTAAFDPIRFDPRRSTVGDLVGKPLGHTVVASRRPGETVGDLVGVPLPFEQRRRRGT